jgi:hypothetical protein
MAKQTGLGDNLYISGYNLSGDIQQVGNVGGGPAALDMTGIDKSGFERQGGVKDGRLEMTSYFNPATAETHDVLGALPTSSVLLTYCRGTALGASAASLLAKQTNYDAKRANDGALTFDVAAQLADGYALEWGQLGTAGVRTDTSATNGSSIDGTAQTTFGLAAYLHVFAFSGTSVTVKLQESSDNGVGDSWADVTGGGFTAATGVTSQRIQTATNLTVERYLRVVTTGTFSNAQFAVAIVRYATEPE